MAALADVVREVVFWYAAKGLELRTFALANEPEGIYAVNVVDTPKDFRPAGVVVIARIVGDHVVIEEDLTDRPLVDRLVEAGIPRERIIKAYAGEALPEGA
jgi:hypothetical protein